MSRLRELRMKSFSVVAKITAYKNQFDFISTATVRD